MAEASTPLCPTCFIGRGFARAVATILGRPTTVTVRYVCEACRHNWHIEQEDRHFDITAEDGLDDHEMLTS